MWPTDYPGFFDEVEDCVDDHCPYADGTCFDEGKCLRRGDAHDD